MEFSEPFAAGMLSPRENLYRKEHAKSEIVTESVGDYILPDYQPEIRKILCLSSVLRPASRYENGGRAECGGSIRHSILYSDADGRLSSVALSSDYDYEADLGPEADGGILLVHESVKSSNCRLTGPRKLTIRTKILSSVASYTEGVAMTVSDGLPKDAELLTKKVAREELLLASGDTVLSGDVEIPTGNPAELRLLFPHAEILFREIRCERDRILCRGDVLLSVIGDDGGTPFTVEEKLPFEEVLPADNVNSEFTAIADGYTGDVKLLTEEKEDAVVLTAEVPLFLTAEARKNAEMTLTRDAYLPGCDLAAEEESLDLLTYTGSATGHFSVSGTVTAKEVDADDALSVVGTFAEAADVRTENENGTYILEGNCRVRAFLASPNGDGGLRYSAAEFTVPFRGEAPAGDLSADRTYYRVTVSRPRVRLDNDALSFEGEIGFSLVGEKTETERYVSTLRYLGDKETEKEAEIIAVYPTSDETLWKIGKEYGISLKEIADVNALPDNALSIPDAEESLAGKGRILIVK